MEIVLADVAPSPESNAGTAVVVVLGCVVLLAALTVLVVWAVRRGRDRAR